MKQGKDVYPIAEARRQLATLIKQAESGKPITLTRRGKPVAVLVSTMAEPRRRKRTSGPSTSFAVAYAKFRKLCPVVEGDPPDGPDWLDGVRDRSPGDLRE